MAASRERFDPTDPAGLHPEQRRAELATILAAGGNGVGGRAARGGAREAEPAFSLADERVPPAGTVLTRAYRGQRLGRGRVLRLAADGDATRAGRGRSAVLPQGLHDAGRERLGPLPPAGP